MTSINGLQPEDINIRLEALEQQFTTLSENRVTPGTVTSLQSAMAQMAGMIAVLGKATNDLRYSVSELRSATAEVSDVTRQYTVQFDRIWEELRNRGS